MDGVKDKDENEKNSESDLPTVIDANNFYDVVIDRKTNMVKGQKPWFIEFFAPWCPHCQ